MTLPCRSEGLAYTEETRNEHDDDVCRVPDTPGAVGSFFFVALRSDALAQSYLAGCSRCAIHWKRGQYRPQVLLSNTPATPLLNLTKNTVLSWVASAPPARIGLPAASDGRDMGRTFSPVCYPRAQPRS